MKITEKTWESILGYGENILGAVIVLVAGVLLVKVGMRILRKLLSKSTLDESIHKFVLTGIRYALYVLIFIVVLTTLKVPTAPLITVLGASGAAVALALKDSLGNIAGGIIILVNKPFKRGDVIEVADVTGMVHSIDLLVTTLKTYDNKVITIPNGTMTASVIVNYSQEMIRRVDCKFGISYDADIAQAKDILLAVAESCEDVLLDPAPVTGVAEHGPSAVILDLKTWCDTSRYWDVKYYLEEHVKLAFDEANITIPYPQMDVHVVK